MGSSGVARHLGYGVDPTAAGQVVERVPQTRQQAADPLTPARAGAAVHPGAFRVRVLRAEHCPAEHRAELPWDFYFPQVHYAVAWIAIGSIAIHLAVKIRCCGGRCESGTSATGNRSRLRCPGVGSRARPGWLREWR